MLLIEGFRTSKFVSGVARIKEILLATPETLRDRKKGIREHEPSYFAANFSWTGSKIFT
jgi:hypothetical protein